MMQGDKAEQPLIRQIQPRNILSFGPDTSPLVMENLNVLIGPNGAGKSNLIEVIGLMRATPVPASSGNVDIHGVVRRGGGVREWIWKGRKTESASVSLVFNNPKGNQRLEHILKFSATGQAFDLVDERIEYETLSENETAPYYFHFQNGNTEIRTVSGEIRQFSGGAMNPELSILAKRWDPKNNPEFSFLAQSYEGMRIYREWAFGRNTVFREPQKADMRNDRLEEDFSNLGLFLNRLRLFPKAKSALLSALGDLYEGVADFEISVQGGTVQVFFTEEDFTIPATRLSDGALHYLCLLAILCDPEPPPLICIEEPELGLHPDILPKLADKLVAASEKTQLIVTTHSDILVDALTEQPETVVVCEKHQGQTQMRRLKKEDLASWLDKYRLGQLWTKGQLGGTRW